MSRIGLTKDIIMQSAMEIVDNKGAENLTLKIIRLSLLKNIYTYILSIFL